MNRLAGMNSRPQNPPPFRRRFQSRLLALTCVLLADLGISNAFQQQTGLTDVAHFANPVLSGDHPDPSIIRVGGSYWMSSTSGDWSPQFPLFRSSDLKHWTPAGAIFPHQPKWAAGSFWAPELVYDRGRVLVYYVGRKRAGPLCVAVATAAGPAGPYTDHGPIECQADGSIDPAFARDENGKPYLIWKEDGNSIHKPTPLWAQALTSDLLHLKGEKIALLVNQPESWEGGVVEAPYVLRHDGHFFLFYAGNACCGTECHYAEGVARADHLLGPYTKNPSNPVIAANATWKCPGHGSAVTTPSGENYFLYHAYPSKGSIYLGRESVLDRIDWNSSGWPTINAGNGPNQTQAKPSTAVSDHFTGPALGAAWQWPVNRQPKFQLLNGTLTLTAGAHPREDYVARSVTSSNYVSSVLVQARGPGLGSLTVIGNASNSFGLGRRMTELELWQQSGEAEHRTLWRGKVPASATVHLRVTATNEGKQLAYSYSLDGKHWISAGDFIDVSRLPQWDQGLRVGVDVQGAAGSSATFADFDLRAQ